MLPKHEFRAGLAAPHSLFDNIELLPGKAAPARLCLEPFAAIVMGLTVRRPSNSNAALTPVLTDAPLMESNVLWPQAESLLRGSPG